MKKINTVKTALALGVLLGLAIAAKATAFVLVAGIFLDFTFSHKDFIAKIKSFGLVLYAMIGIGGMHYITNFIYYGKLLAAPDNFPEYFSFLQPVSPRNFEFFTTMKGFFAMDLFQSHHFSFLSGTYFSWFYDGHNIVIPVQEFSKAGTMLIFMSFPIFFLMVFGFIQTVKHLNIHNRIFVLYTVLLFGSYILYNFHLPYFSTVKGSFIASLALPAGYFFLKGFDRFQKYSGVVSLYFLVYSLILVKHFWILDWWY